MTQTIDVRESHSNNLGHLVALPHRRPSSNWPALLAMEPPCKVRWSRVASNNWHLLMLTPIPPAYRYEPTQDCRRGFFKPKASVCEDRRGSKTDDLCPDCPCKLPQALVSCKSISQPGFRTCMTHRIKVCRRGPLEEKRHECQECYRLETRARRDLLVDWFQL
jgi:hypothetical protein